MKLFHAWFFYVAVAVWFPDAIERAAEGASIVQSPMRKMMFMLTFVSIGIITDFSKLKGMGRLALLYGIALFVIIAPHRLCRGLDIPPGDGAATGAVMCLPVLNMTKA